VHFAIADFDSYEFITSSIGLLVNSSAVEA